MRTPRSRPSSPSKTAAVVPSAENSERRRPPTPRSPAVRVPQIPIGALEKQPPTSPRFPPWEAFERRPRRLQHRPQKGRRPKPFTEAGIHRNPCKPSRRADTAPPGVASGTTGVCAKAAIRLRARNCLHCAARPRSAQRRPTETEPSPMIFSKFPTCPCRCRDVGPHRTHGVRGGPIAQGNAVVDA